MLLPVDFLLEESARFEGENLAGGDGEGFAGLGIAPRAVAFLLHDELAEAGEFDFLTGGQRFLDDVQDGRHDRFGFFSLEVAICSNVFYQVLFCHGMDFYHKTAGKGKRETLKGPHSATGLPEAVSKIYFFFAAFFFFGCTAS